MFLFRRSRPGPNASERLEHAFLPTQGSKGADIGDEQRRAKLVVVAKRPQCQTAVFKADSTTTSIVACLHHFVLQRALDRIIGERGGCVPAFAIHLAPAAGHAYLVLPRLEDRIGVQSELSEAEERLPERAHRGNQTDDG